MARASSDDPWPEASSDDTWPGASSDDPWPGTSSDDPSPGSSSDDPWPGASSDDPWHRASSDDQRSGASGDDPRIRGATEAGGSEATCPPGLSPIESGFAARVRTFGGREGVLSRPDLREPFISLFWLGQGVTRVGSDFFFLCWPGMVPNQRQLSIIVSVWGSYLGSLFSTCCVWDLVYV
jgi:hypothetical protein